MIRRISFTRTGKGENSDSEGVPLPLVGALHQELVGCEEMMGVCVEGGKCVDVELSGGPRPRRGGPKKLTRAAARGGREQRRGEVDSDVGGRRAGRRTRTAGRWTRGAGQGLERRRMEHAGDGKRGYFVLYSE